MGLNINVINAANFADHPDWDSVRYGGDRDFVALASTLPSEEMPYTLSDSSLIRPVGFDAWREAINKHGFDNSDRYLNLLHILETDESYWLNVSY